MGGRLFEKIKLLRFKNIFLRETKSARCLACDVTCIKTTTPQDLRYESRYIDRWTAKRSNVLFDVAIECIWLVLGTRFRPLSLEIPKPLFPVGGQPMIEHHIEACIQVGELKNE